MAIYFYPFVPKRVPRTHRLRNIGFEEFVERMLEAQRPVLVEACHQRFVLTRTLGVDFGRDIQIPYISLGEKFPLRQLGESDRAVVITRYGVSTWMGWISPQDKEGILRGTRFAVIEPQ